MSPPYKFRFRLRWLLFLLCGAVAGCAGADSGQTRIEDLLDQARKLEKVSNYSGAEQIYEQALTTAPENLEVRKRLGILQQTELKFAESIQTFQRVLVKDSSYSQTNFFLGVSYYGQGDISKAITSLQRELETPHPHPRTRFYLATLLQASGRDADAIQQLNQSLAENPKDSDALYQLARLHKNASFHAMEKLKELDPDSFQVHLLLGELYADEQRYPEAVKEYQAAQDKRASAQGIHYAIGVAYWAQNQFAPAEKEFQAALRENPKDALTNLYLGDIAVRDRRFAEAMQFLDAAQLAQPGMAQVHVLLGKCYQGQNQLDKAKEELLTAIEADPSVAQAHYLLAQVYRKLNDSAASANELAKFEQLSKMETEKAPSPGGAGSEK